MSFLIRRITHIQKSAMNLMLNNKITFWLALGFLAAQTCLGESLVKHESSVLMTSDCEQNSTEDCSSIQDLVLQPNLNFKALPTFIDLHTQLRSDNDYLEPSTTDILFAKAFESIARFVDTTFDGMRWHDNTSHLNPLDYASTQYFLSIQDNNLTLSSDQTLSYFVR